MTIRQTIKDYDDVMTFGKYKGNTVGQIAEDDPGYIVWLRDEKIVRFPKEIIEAAELDYMNQFPPEDFFWETD